jgi:uncharacterized membrane protein
MLSDWRWVWGTQLSRGACVALGVVAALAIGVSALALWRERRRGRARLLLGLRSAAVLLCLLVAYQPKLEFGQVTVIPNQVAVILDTSRSMGVVPPDRGASRYQRALALLAAAKPTFAEWSRTGHPVGFYALGESLTPTTEEALAAPPTGEATRLGEAVGELSERLAGRDVGAVVLLSDGIDTGRLGRGGLDEEARKALATIGAPVHTILLGEPELRDLSIAQVLADDFAFVRSPIKLEAVIRHHGLPGRMIEVSLLREGKTMAAKMVTLRAEVEEERVIFDFTPDRPGNFVFEVRTPVLLGEALPNNNQHVFTVRVIRDRVRVLHVNGRPSWDERFLRSMLRLNPNVDLVSFFILRTDTDEMPLGRGAMSLIPFPYREIFDEQLKTFDLLIFHNFNFKPYWVEPYLPGVRRYVEAGGALAMIGGDLSFASGLYGTSALAEALPVRLNGIPVDGPGSFTTDEFRPRLTPEGRTHPVTALSLDEHDNAQAWAALPALEGINKVAGLMPGARALLTHPKEKSADGKPAPVLAVRDVGQGRSLALLVDSAWNWAFPAAGQGQDGRAFQRFWESAMRWLVRDPALTLLRLELQRSDYRREQPVLGRVRTLRPDFSPAPGVVVAVEARKVGDPESIVRQVELVTGPEGDAALDLGLLAPGAYRLSGRATLEGKPVEERSTFVVRAEGKELSDVVARPALLRAMSEASGGVALDGEWGNFAVNPPRKVRVGSVRAVEIWCHPLLLLLVVGLLATEWALRRRAGHS